MRPQANGAACARDPASPRIGGLALDVRRPALLACALTGLLPGTSSALEWQQAPRVSVTTADDSNLDLRSTDASGIAWSMVEAETRVEAQDERVELDFAPRVRSLRYEGAGERNRDDLFATLGVAVKGERQQWSLAGDYALESTLTSEFEYTGFVDTSIERRRSNWTGSWQRSAGERTSYRLLLERSDVDYQEAFLSPLVDYRYGVLQASLSQAVSERSSLSVSVSRTRLDVPAYRGRTTSIGLNADWDRRISETLKGRIGVGRFEAKADGASAGNSGALLDLSLVKQWNAWDVTLSLGSDLQPTGRAALVREDTLSLRLRHALAPRTSFDLRLEDARVRTEASPLRREDRDFAWASWALHRRLGERTSLDAELRWRAQQFVGADPAGGSAVIVSFSYRSGRL